MIRLYRTSTSDEGTFGYLMFGGMHVRTLELPWRNNRPNLSSIPPGRYSVQVRISPRHGKCYHITAVPGRTFILFHSGNFGGDVQRGYRSNIAGCVLLGTHKARLYGQQAVLGSRIARIRFESALKWEPFTMEIINRC